MADLFEPTISRIFFLMIPEASRQELLARLPIREGVVLSDDLLEKTRQVVREFEHQLQLQITTVAGENRVNLTLYDAARFQGRIKMEAAQQARMLLEKVLPEPTPAAGAVQLSIVIAKDGTVQEVSPVSGPESLYESASNAVKHWRYRPTLLNGIPVEVKTTVEIAC